MSLPVALEDELTGELKSAFVLPDVDQIVLRPPVCSSLSSVIYRKKMNEWWRWLTDRNFLDSLQKGRSTKGNWTTLWSEGKLKHRNILSFQKPGLQNIFCAMNWQMTTHSWQCWVGRSARRRGRGRGTWGRCRSRKPCSNRQDERWKLWHLRLNLMHFSNHAVLLPLPHYTESRGQKQRWMAFQNVSLSQERKKKMRSNSAVNVMLFPPQFIEIAKQQWILAKKILHQLSVPNIWIWLQH